MTDANVLRVWVLGAGATVGMFAWLGVALGYPTIWSPLPAATIVPMLWSSMLIGGRHVDHWAFWNGAPVVLGAAYFFVWNSQLFRGRAEVPKRSRIGLMVLTVLTIGSFVVGWDYGLKYQGRGHTVGMLALNVVALALCWVACLRAIRSPSFPRSLAFHWGTTVWLVWLAFPWLGEML